ncbi:PH domain-containing protein [Candidatus Woesebacteria bacterium]|nr:MAG: PH domain-containing protein [Candidatus Woesebacteria bacterium]
MTVTTTQDKHHSELNNIDNRKRFAPERARRRKRLDMVLENDFRKKAPDSESSFCTTFCYYPSKIKFAGEDPEEEIILLLRKHPFTNIGWILLVFVLLILPAFLSVFPFFDQMAVGFQIMAYIVWYMIVTALVLEEFLSWYFHVNIVTDERIIEVDFLNLIYREITDCNIDRIEDVTVKIGGGLRTLFNFGDVQIQTSAEIPQIKFEDVPRPDVVAKILRELRLEEEQEQLEGRVR